jgi:hypothetical protein
MIHQNQPDTVLHNVTNFMEIENCMSKLKSNFLSPLSQIQLTPRLAKKLERRRTSIDIFFQILVIEHAANMFKVVFLLHYFTNMLHSKTRVVPRNYKYI